jgi:hypothetical protein
VTSPAMADSELVVGRDFIRFSNKPNGKLRLSTDLPKISFHFQNKSLNFEFGPIFKLILLIFSDFAETGGDQFCTRYRFLNPYYY